MRLRSGSSSFVLDDGWFGKRDDDTCSLGDWKVNRQKMGGTLREFADKVRKNGLMFGIWMEPEMISKDSDLFRAHPEYALSVPGKETMEIRHQRVLDLTNPEVRRYMIGAISSVIEESGASYLKWDCNRGIFDLPGRRRIVLQVHARPVRGAGYDHKKISESAHRKLCQRRQQV